MSRVVEKRTRASGARTSPAAVRSSRRSGSTTNVPNRPPAQYQTSASQAEPTINPVTPSRSGAEISITGIPRLITAIPNIMNADPKVRRDSQ